MVTQVMYLLEQGQNRAQLANIDFNRNYVLYSDISEKLGISKREIDSVRDHYFGLFSAVYNNTGTNLVGEAIERSKLGDFIHYELDTIVQAFGIDMDSALNLAENNNMFKSKIDSSIAMISLKEFFEEFKAFIVQYEGKALDASWIKKNYVILEAFGEGEFLEYNQVVKALDAVLESLYKTSEMQSRDFYTKPIDDFSSKDSPKAKVIQFRRPQTNQQEEIPEEEIVVTEENILMSSANQFSVMKTRAPKEKVSNEIYDVIRLYINEIITYPLLDKDRELRLMQGIEYYQWQVAQIIYSTPHAISAINKLEQEFGETFNPKLIPGYDEECGFEVKDIFEGIRNLDESQDNYRFLNCLDRQFREKLEATIRTTIEQYLIDIDPVNASLLVENAENVLERIIDAETKVGNDKEKLKSVIRELYEYDSQANELKDEMYVSNLRLVVSIANRYKNRGVDLSDLIQEGNEGLRNAVNRVNHRTGLRFSTYAGWMIRHKIKRYIENNHRDVRIPSYIQELQVELDKCISQYMKKYQEQPSVKYLAKKYNKPEEDIERALACKNGMIGFNSPVGENGATLEDFIPDENSPDPTVLVAKNELASKIELLLKMLPPREEKVLRMRNGIGEYEPHTLEQIGLEFNFTREAIRKIEIRAMKRIRRQATQEGLKQFLNMILH